MNDMINIVIPIVIILVGMSLFKRYGKFVANAVIAVGAFFMLAYFFNLNITDVLVTLFNFTKTALSFMISFFKTVGGLFSIT